MKFYNTFPAALGFILFSLGCPVAIIAQGKLSNDTIIYPGTRIKTDVFVLNTCDLTQVSFRRKYDDDRLYYDRNMTTRKLQIASNRLSAFKIEGINPLRYNFYINNEIVSQFMDPDPLKIAGNTFADRALAVPEIRYIELFKTKFESNPQLETMKAIRKQMEDINSVFEKISNEMDEIKSVKKEYESSNKHSAASKKKYDEDLKRYNDLKKRTTNLSDSIIVKVNEYEFIANNLAINHRSFALLDRWQNIKKSYAPDPALYRILDRVEEFAKKYKETSKKFDTINRYLSNPDLYPEKGSSDPLRIKPSTVIKTLNSIGYFSDVYFIQNYDSTLPGDIYADNLFYVGSSRIKEFMISRKFQAYEEIVLSLSAEIGKLLQNKVLDCSQLLNSLENIKCVDTTLVKSSLATEDSLTQVFKFIQEMSADIYVLVSFLNIDISKYKDIIENINKSYTELLIYMRYLAHLKENNTIEYTLPTSTNLKNIDLIRYAVRREDKLTGGSQTYLYDFWIKGGLKIDFSAGIFASALTDNQYEKFQDGNNIVHIKRKETGEYSFGFGGMVNIAPRLGANWLNGGLSFGVIYSTNQRLQFLGGGSFHLGKTERIILHAGVAFGTINILDESSDNFLTVKRKKEFLAPGNASDFKIVTIEKFTARPFFGLSYNLSRKNALQAVSGPGKTKFDNELQGDPKTKTVTQ